MANTHTGTGACAQTWTHRLTWPLLLLASAALIVYMSGLAAIQNWCDGSSMGSSVSSSLGSSLGSLLTAPIGSMGGGVFGMSASPLDCHRLYRFYWFSWAFVLATLLGIAATLLCNWGLHNSRPFWIGMLTISTILMMVASEAFLAITVLYEGGDQSNQWPHRLRATTAGAIMTIPFLIGLMLAIGTNWEHRTDTVHTKPGTGLVGAHDPAVTTV